MRPPKAAPVALGHQPGVHVVDAGDLPFYGDRGEVAEAQQPPGNMPGQLGLDPDLRKPRPVELRDDTHGERIDQSASG